MNTNNSREKEIAHAAESEYFSTKAEEFAWIHGAKWSDQHPRKGLWDSEKVIEWLRANIHDYYEVNEFQEWFDSMYKDLKEAMEE